MRRVGVPEVVEPNAGKFARLGQEPNELVRQAIRLERLAVHLRDDVALVGQPDANPQKLFRLLKSGSAHSSTTKAGRATVRARPLLVSLNRTPVVVCSVLSTIANCFRARSTEPQRKAVISPRRSPHMTASRTGTNIGVPRKWASSRAVSPASSAAIFGRSTLGGSTLSTGLRCSIRHAPRTPGLLQDTVHVVDGPRRQAAGAVPSARFQGFRIRRRDLVRAQLG